MSSVFLVIYLNQDLYRTLNIMCFFIFCVNPDFNSFTNTLRNLRYWNINFTFRKEKKIILAILFPHTIFTFRRRKRGNRRDCYSIAIFAFINGGSLWIRDTYFINGSMLVIFSTKQTFFKLFSIVNWINFRISTTIYFFLSSCW